MFILRCVVCCNDVCVCVLNLCVLGLLCLSVFYCVALCVFGVLLVCAKCLPCCIAFYCVLVCRSVAYRVLLRYCVVLFLPIVV